MQGSDWHGEGSVRAASGQNWVGMWSVGSAATIDNLHQTLSLGSPRLLGFVLLIEVVQIK